MLDEFTCLLILAYFKEFNEDYSLLELKDILGISLEALNDDLVELIRDEQLYLNEDHLISLTHKGRIHLLNSKMENYKFTSDYFEEKCLLEKWPIARPYCAHKFKQYKWRGSEE